MLARREALLSAGLLDERFFIYSEETDFCLRIKQAGWDVRHLPDMTIVHHAGKGGVSEKMVAQDAYARRQYAAKHFTPGRRLAATACACPCASASGRRWVAGTSRSTRSGAGRPGRRWALCSGRGSHRSASRRRGHSSRGGARTASPVRSTCRRSAAPVAGVALPFLKEG